jgi:5-methylcytosine-specific restriction protein B
MNVNLEEEIIAFLNGYLEEAKKKFSFLKGDKIAGKTQGYFFNSNKNGLLTGTYVGVSVDYESNKLNVFLRFWEEEEKEKNYENIEKKLNILEGHSREFQNFLGVDVWYHHYEKQVRGFMSDNDDGIRGFSVTFPAYKKLGKEIKNDLDTALSAIKLMKDYMEEPLTDDSDVNDKTLLKRIQVAMDAQSEGHLECIKLKDGFLQYKPVNANSNDWRDSACHYEFREDGKGNMQICFHCESKFSNQIEFKNLVEKEKSFKSSFFGNKTTIDYKRIPLSSEKLVDDAVDGMLEFEKLHGSKILELIQKSKGEILSENSNNAEENMSASEINEKEIALNTILYGPPGTGKTFNTMAYAVAICEDKNVEDIKREMQEETGYKFVKQRYEALKDKGCIEFVTFHQSYGYEDFIEGIRPRVANDNANEETTGLDYYLRPGIFKDFCDRAKSKFINSVKDSESQDDFDKSWKSLLDKIDQSDTEKIQVKLKNGKFFSVGHNETKTGLYGGSHRYFNKKQIRNVYEGQLGVPSGTLDSYRRRIVEYMIEHCNLPKITRKKEIRTNENQKYVFIIDEINRGNISKIFGELITLIEPSKRLGEKESMKVTLPCSGDEFGVPNNVYILGTMNTADRSIAMMDSALRRRFNFVEMMPDTSVLKNYKGNDIGVDICKMLETINERIEYLYDREHTIGHAFFIGVDSLKKLSSVFKNKVIPLLQEYFYDDYEKIRIVLGDDEKEEKYQFITRARPREGLFKKSNDAEYLNTEKYIYRINQEAEDFDEPDYYKGII